MYDDEDDDDSEISIERDAETLRREGAEGARGIEDRAFYDDLAKKEDDRHNEMRKEKQKRSLAVGEMRQKMRHKDAEARALVEKIQREEDRIVFEQKKAYRRDAREIVDGAPVGAASVPIQEINPIRIRESNPDNVTEEFSIERAQFHIKLLKEQKAELDKIVAEMHMKLNEEERSLSQLEHQVARM